MTHAEAVNTLASERYLLGEMTEAEREAFEAHYFECAECAEDVQLGAQMAEGARVGLLEPPVVRQFAPRTRPARWLASPVLPWAVAASLAVVLVYQAGPGRRSSPTLPAALALAPVTLRTATRGQEASVDVSPGAQVVTLAVDVPFAASTAALTYELRQDGGAVIASGQVPAPQPGAPLLLLIPAHLLTPSARYILAMRDSVHPGLTPAEYGFTVVAR
jgi:anti-sigma factor RsiW